MPVYFVREKHACTLFIELNADGYIYDPFLIFRGSNNLRWQVADNVDGALIVFNPEAYQNGRSYFIATHLPEQPGPQ